MNDKTIKDGDATALTHKLKLRVFNSFDDMADAEALDAAMQSPAERIRETVELILRVYGVSREQLIAQRKPMHINITHR